MSVSFRLGMSFRHPRIEDGNAAAVFAPALIALFIPMAALWLTFALLHSAAPGLGMGQQIALALCGGVAPVVIAYGVMTNRSWTRIGILATIATNIAFFAAEPGTAITRSFADRFELSVALAAFVALGAYLYLGSKPRAYYLLIAGKSLPDELKQVDLAPPDWLASGMRSLGGVAEWILIGLALAIFFGLLLFLP